MIFFQSFRYRDKPSLVIQPHLVAPRLHFLSLRPCARRFFGTETITWLWMHWDVFAQTFEGSSGRIAFRLSFSILKHFQQHYGVLASISGGVESGSSHQDTYKSTVEGPFAQWRPSGIRSKSIVADAYYWLFVFSTLRPLPRLASLHSPLSALHTILRLFFVTRRLRISPFAEVRSKSDFTTQLDLERLANSDGNGLRYDALKRRVYQSAIPGTMSFQSNTGFQSSHPSHSSPVHSRPLPPSNSMAPSSQTHRESKWYIKILPIAR